jgi:hypothetical protein
MQAKRPAHCSRRATGLRGFGRVRFMLAKSKEGSRGRGKSSTPLPTSRSMTAHPLVRPTHPYPSRTANRTRFIGASGTNLSCQIRRSLHQTTLHPRASGWSGWPEQKLDGWWQRIGDRRNEDSVLDLARCTSLRTFEKWKERRRHGAIGHGQGPCPRPRHRRWRATKVWSGRGRALVKQRSGDGT